MTSDSEAASEPNAKRRYAIYGGTMHHHPYREHYANQIKSNDRMNVTGATRAWGERPAITRENTTLR